MVFQLFVSGVPYFIRAFSLMIKKKLIAVMKQTYLSITQEAGRRFIMRKIEGPVVMLNLLRFCEVADYSAFPELKPENPISGKEAYQKYIAHTLPFLKKIGRRNPFYG